MKSAEVGASLPIVVPDQVSGIVLNKDMRAVHKRENDKCTVCVYRCGKQRCKVTTKFTRY
jgi:hypothetical protein